MRAPWIVVCSVSLALGGCQSSEPKSPYHLATSSGSVASSFADRLLRVSKSVRDSEAVVRDSMGGLPTAADKLKDPDWSVVAQVIERAEQSGRDDGYSAEMRSLRSVHNFFEQEHEALVKKVGGAAHYAGKQRGCDIELWSPVASSLEDGVAERIRDRLRANNDAFLVIERHKEQLGKANIAPLEELADEVALSSYIVGVGLPELRERLHETAKGAEHARAALEKEIQAERAYQDLPGLRIEDRKASDARSQAHKGKISELKTAEAEARANLGDLEKRHKQLAEDYAVALSTLKDDVASRKSTK